MFGNFRNTRRMVKVFALMSAGLIADCTQERKESIQNNRQNGS